MESQFVLAGINDGFERKPLLDADEVKLLLAELDNKLNSKMQREQEMQAEARQLQCETGGKFIQQARESKKYQTLEGALYHLVKPGKGEKIAADSTIEFYLTGRLADGTVFDRSGDDKLVQTRTSTRCCPSLPHCLASKKLAVNWK